MFQLTIKSYKIASHYGAYRPGSIPNFHNGVDIATPLGTEIFAPFDGVLLLKNSDAKKIGGVQIYFVGKTRISLEGNLCIGLAHLDKVFFNPTLEYKKGDRIATTGNSGNVAPHLHLTCRLVKHPYQPLDEIQNFQTFNPLSFFKV